MRPLLNSGTLARRVTQLEPRDRHLITKCLEEALDERYFPEWEFPVLMGFSRAELRAFLSKPVPERFEIGAAPWKFVCSVLNNLIRYPHGRTAHLERSLGASSSELEALSHRLHG
jgi:hypothetical protein